MAKKKILAVDDEKDILELLEYNLGKEGYAVSKARISDFCAFLMLGELIEFDKTGKIFTAPSEKVTEDYITGRFG